MLVNGSLALPVASAGADIGALFNAQAIQFDFWHALSSAGLVSAGGNPVFFGLVGTNSMVRISVGGANVFIGVYVSSGALMTQKQVTWAAALQKITITVDMSAGTLEVAGATTGDGVATGTAGVLASGGTCKLGMHGATAATTWQFDGVISRLRAP